MENAEAKNKAVMEKMDAAADQAAEELHDMDAKDVEPVARWWKKWYLKAGHKRLGRALVGWAKDHKIN